MRSRTVVMLVLLDEVLLVAAASRMESPKQRRKCRDQKAMNQKVTHCANDQHEQHIAELLLSLLISCRVIKHSDDDTRSNPTNSDDMLCVIHEHQLVCVFAMFLVGNALGQR